MPGTIPYLNFDGNTMEAFDFYKSVFGGDYASVMKMNEAPGLELPDAEKNRIMHITLPIGKDAYLMGSDTVPSLGHKLVVGNNNYICLNPESREESDRIFNALSKGGEVEMAMADMFWGAYYGTFKDKFGIHWMINYHESPMQ